MASSRKSKLTDTLAARLAPLLPAHSHILIGLSGGMDSVVLLHLLHALAPRFNWRLSALHVHHGISPNAEAWAHFCTGLCGHYAIALHIERVDVRALSAEHGVEAAARMLRHAAFLRQPCDCVALAQHADDQAETLLLQLLRGSGVRGVAAMPFFKGATPRMHATLRPLLDIARSELLAYAQEHELAWVEDESNADDGYPRNFLRQRVLPLFQQRFPAYRDTLARSARHFAESADLLDELARQDAQGADMAISLDVARLCALSPPRARNLLRYFLHARGVPMPQTRRLEEMLHQLCTARADAALSVEVGAWQVHRYQGRVHVAAVPAAFDPLWQMAWQGEPELDWAPLRTRVCFHPGQGSGIDLARLRQGSVSLRLRRGGEALRPHSGAATRSLKNLLQEQALPPWLRPRWPLLYCGETLVCVVGVAVAAEYQAQPGRESVSVVCV